MDINDKAYTFDRMIRISITIFFICGLVWLLGYLSDVLIPFAVAFLMAYLINPLVVSIKRKIKNNTASVFITLVLLIVLCSFFAWLIIPMIINEIKHMGRLVSELVSNSDLAREAAKRLPPDLWQAMKDYSSRSEVQEFFKTDNFLKISETFAKKALPGIWGVITGTTTILMGLVGLTVIALYLVFLLLDFQKVQDSWKGLLPNDYREPVTEFVNDFDSAMKRYFRAQAVTASIVGAMFSFGFWLIGLPMGILLGLFIGLLNMVPYLQLAGLIPAFFLSLVLAIESGGSFTTVLSLTGLVFIVIQLIQDAILVPKIMGDATGLSPAIILLSLSIWGKLLGFFGLIIAIPVTCLLSAYYLRFIASTKTELRRT
ncbi:MAG: AI-2E family transporter [Desulfobacterales bacterium]|jgi:predicted PurR-regulated permease PerM|nr:AI-2E family transporter [Desulfobacteraceae bacterium]MBT4364254.1 AI-2E family transporter [Desulfobacteraceae bacterium]MBT7086686.1 AI-2E family transporter [Desulfobacterales bacterium]MBT7697609.1 AI-2E family transporter [Desulfobacterales bacterium]